MKFIDLLTLPFKQSTTPSKQKVSLAQRNAQRAGDAESNYSFIDGLGNTTGRVRIPSYFKSKDPIPAWERAELIEMGRYLYSNDGIVKAAIDELARYTFPLKPQASTDSHEWNEKAERYFDMWCYDADIKQRLHFYDIQRIASISLDRDGDVGVVMVKKPEGGYAVQLIEADRIIEHPRNKAKAGLNGKGKKEYDQGVKMDGLGRPKSYCVQEDNKNGFRIIPASAMLLLYDPERCDQIRGISSVAHAVAHIRDKKDILSFEKQGVKNLSSFSAVLKSDYSDVDEDAFELNEIDGYDAEGETTEVSVSQMQSGEIPILRKGEELDVVSQNRPSSSFQGFLEFLVREFAVGLGLPYEFVWDSQGLTGPSQRFIMGKAQRKFEERQRLFFPMIKRAWLMVISDAIARNKLPAPPEGWERCRIQTPAKLTIDIGREAQAERDDVAAGLMTLEEHFGRRGMDWQTEVDQATKEVTYLVERAKKVAKESDIPLEMALVRIGGQVEGVSGPLFPTPEKDEPSPKQMKQRK